MAGELDWVISGNEDLRLEKTGPWLRPDRETRGVLSLGTPTPPPPRASSLDCVTLCPFAVTNRSHRRGRC